MREYDCLDDDSIVRTDHEHLCGECRSVWFGWKCLAGSCDLEPRESEVCPNCSVAALDWHLREEAEEDARLDRRSDPVE